MSLPYKCFKKFSVIKLYPLFFSLIFISLLAIIISVIKKEGYHITYATTASMPQGFYLVVPIRKIARYDIVEFLPPPNALNFIKAHRWVPDSGLVIKNVFAIPGDDVCAHNGAIWINGKKTGKIYHFYAFKKLLPQTKICGKLKDDQYLLLSVRKEHSFDGRYFGTISSKRILGRAIPFLTYDHTRK